LYLFLLIIYFSINLLGGNRGLFAYLDKKNDFLVLNNKKGYLEKEILKLKKFNSLLGDNLDIDYIEILARDKFAIGKKDEKTYIFNDE
jgi:Septum formation initiator.